MRRTINRILLGLCAAGLASVAFAGPAAAYPVGPWGVEGPCKGREPNQCPFSHSEDGLTWSYRGVSWNYDKYGDFVCSSDQFWCGPLMVVVRALPPTPFGAWLPG
ncbi:hypothetical protein [Nocardia mexicana]|uniref:Secreted protein n=1 Tax=Nocardia mexicana TaxID=279262 RepID=A0A370HGN0_9NOCA|nr:hypothetical protein [Nocardia mexicana]RDI54314.1 hypothetical protein DFR68_102438 [Nocardia mexicana]